MALKIRSGVKEKPEVEVEPVFPGELKQLDFSNLPGEAGWGFARVTGRKQELIGHMTMLQVYPGLYGMARGPHGELVAAGIETFLPVISEHLAEHYPMTIHMVCRTYDPQEKPYSVKKDGWKGEVIVHPIHRFGSNPAKHSRDVIRLMQETDADIIHLHNPADQTSLGIALAAHAMKRGLAVTYHSEPQNFSWDISPSRDLNRAMEILRENWSAEGWRGLGQFLIALAQKGLGRLIPPKGMSLLVYNLAERVPKSPFASYRLCTISEESAAEFGRRDSLVVGNPINMDMFSPENADPVHCSQLRRDHGLEGKKVILYHSRINPMKGQHFLAESAKNLQERIGDNFRIVFIGTVQDEQYYHGMIETARREHVEDKLLFLGAASQEDIRDWLNIADLMVFPSLKEGLGRCGIEALSMKKPVVAFKVGGIPEYVKDGETGYLVEKADREGLVEAIGKVLTDPEKAREMGENGRKLAEEKYSTDKVCRDYMNLVFAPIAVSRRTKPSR